MTTRFRPAAPRPTTDLRLLPARDRAIVRIINRSKAAKNDQLADLTRAHVRKIQHRTRLLWQAGYLERTNLPPADRGGSPIVYRLTPTARLRLGYRDRRVAGIAELQHRLDTLETVRVLARPHDNIEYPVQGWLSEVLAGGHLGGRAQPDSIVIVQLASGSAVLCLEVDEATQHAPVIRRKLLAYREALEHRPGWHLLFIVPSDARRSWLLRQAAVEPTLRGWARGWVAQLPHVVAAGLDASAWAVGAAHTTQPLHTIVADRLPRRCPTPLGSRGWIGLLATGGGEELSEALR
jgi:Replication-relaxation